MKSNNEFRIFSGIKIPEGKKPKGKKNQSPQNSYPFAAMNVGDCIYCAAYEEAGDGDVKMRRFGNAARSWAKKVNVSRIFSTRKVDNDFLKNNKLPFPPAKNGGHIILWRTK